jgi:cytochrome c-type biogenesis protein CcmH/NrfF
MKVKFILWLTPLMILVIIGSIGLAVAPKCDGNQQGIYLGGMLIAGCKSD